MIEIYQFDVVAYEQEVAGAVHARTVQRTIRCGDVRHVNVAECSYKHVATVDTDDLDEAFRLTNLWDDEDRVEKKAPMHSTSVGDVLKTPDGTYHLVDNVGFTQPIWA